MPTASIVRGEIDLKKPPQPFDRAPIVPPPWSVHLFIHTYVWTILKVHILDGFIAILNDKKLTVPKDTSLMGRR